MYVHRLPSLCFHPAFVTATALRRAPAYEQAEVLKDAVGYEISENRPFYGLFQTPVFLKLSDELKFNALKALSLWGADPNSLDKMHQCDSYERNFYAKWGKFWAHLYMEPGGGIQGIVIKPAPTSLSLSGVNLFANPKEIGIYRQKIGTIVQRSSTLKETARNLMALYKEMEGPPHFPLACAVGAGFWEIIPFFIEEEGLPQSTTKWFVQQWDYEGGLLDYLVEGPFDVWQLAAGISGWDCVAVLSSLMRGEGKLPVEREQEIREKLRTSGLPEAVFDAVLYPT